MSKVKTGRYSIGEEIYACGFVYSDSISILHPFMMFNQNTPTDIKFIKLTVKEHHRVSNDWGDDLDYDGYILTAEDGTVFTNQYPRAIYGRASDFYDRVFYIDSRGKTKEDFKKLHENVTKIPTEYVTISEVFTPMFKAVTQDQNKLPVNLLNGLTKLVERFNEIFEKQFPDMELVTSPLVFTRNDGTKNSYPHILKTTVVKKEKIEKNNCV